jgi:hypothetical protein
VRPWGVVNASEYVGKKQKQHLRGVREREGKVFYDAKIRVFELLAEKGGRRRGKEKTAPARGAGRGR